MSTKNPLTHGFHVVRRDPALLLIEILWRWSFGATGLLPVLGFLVTQRGVLSPDDASSHDPLVVSQSLAHLLAGLGGPRLRTAIGFLLAATALWTLLGAFGRTITLNRLERSRINFRSILALQSLRAILLWLAGTALVWTFILDARIAGPGARRDLFLYSALAVWTVVLIGAIWAIVNWHLSLAAACCAKNAGGFGRSIRQALGLARSHSGDLLGVSLVFALWRLMALAAAFVLLFLPSSMMGTSPRVYFAWCIIVILAYFAASDYLYISRMAEYLAIDPLEPGGEETGARLSGMSGNKPIAL